MGMQKRNRDIENQLVVPKDREKREGQTRGIRLTNTNCCI